MIDYFIHIADPLGKLLLPSQRIASTEGASCQYTFNVGRSGVALITFPLNQVDPDFLMKDGRIGIWRSVNGRDPILENSTLYLIRKWRYTEDATQIWAYAVGSIRGRRAVAYQTGTTYSEKTTAAADNQMRTVWLENFGSGIVTSDRAGDDTGADISAYVTTQAAKGLGPSLPTSIAWDQVDKVMEIISDTAAQLGTYVTSDIVAFSESALEFQTFTTVRGTDRRVGTSSAVIFSRENGTLENIELVVDATEEVTAVIALGAGDASNRLVQVALDTTRIAESPFGRIEAVINESSVTSDTALLNLAKAKLYDSRPSVKFTADLKQVSKIRGVHYNIGDLVTARFRGKQYDCRLDQLIVYIGYKSTNERCVLTGI